LSSTRHMNLTVITTARHSQGVWVVPCSSRGLHHPIRVAGCQKRLRGPHGNSPILGWTWLPLGNISIWHSSPNAHKWLASRTPPSEATCQQDVFLVKILNVNAIGEQVRTPAEICSGIYYRLASPLPWAVRMCFLLTRQPNRASCGCVLVQVRSVAGPRTAWSASGTAKCAAFPAKRRRTAARSQELL